MDSYQLEIFDMFSKFRPSPKYPTYPPYHKGLYLEDYFIKWFFENNIECDRYFIPVSWTTCYVDNCYHGIQVLLDNLKQDKKYFTVAQHDDAIREKLPINTLSFNAGGNAGGIPIPLVCSPIKYEKNQKLERDIFCSFVGSITHPIRSYIYSLLKNNHKYFFSIKNWTSSVSDDDFNKFINITSRSIFALAPRGYGRSSFRLYEVMQLGAIPVYIYDYKWTPFDDELNWNDFCVMIHVSQINNIDNILSSYTDDKIKQMQKNIFNCWINNFTMESICKKIIERI